MAALSKVPPATWGEAKEQIQEVYPLDSYQKSYNVVKSPVTLCIQINRPHGRIWTFPEVDAFINSYLIKGAPLLKIGPTKMAGDKAGAIISGSATVTKVQLDYANAKDRVWQSVPAEVNGKSVTVKLPAVRPIIFYFNVTDEHGLSISNPHVELPPVPNPQSH